MTTAVTIPCVTLQFNFNLDGTRENFNNVTAQFNLPLDFDLAKLHAHTDKVVEVVDRQRLKYRYTALKSELHVAEVTKENMQTDLERLQDQARKTHEVSGKRGAYKPSLQQAQQLQTARNNIEAVDARVIRIKAEIVATEEKLGLNVSTDRQPSGANR